MIETPDRTESIFAAAIALATAPERVALLDRECVGDQALRGRVEALLRAHDRAGHLLDRPVPGSPEQTAGYFPGEQPGTIIAGRYKLLEAIGEGGMGTVWVAEQTQPVRRKVALKLIKAGMDSKSVLARFEAERQALAVMDHPNIAKVLDGGLTDTGRPFFVMEYVKGVPITEYCDATRLSVPERLNLFGQVCAAVQHAHQKGIIHRDLKPSNILVAPYDDKPVPKVIDFGLAKAMHQSLTERTLHTAHETVLGTPLYMSPEQAQLNNLDVDTRTDIYSLGVLLYELLTGTTPVEKQRFKEAAWDEIRRVIREEEAPRPSMRLSSSQALPSLAASRHTEPARLTKLVRGELDWIVMKALDKDRTRRYSTASEFAADINRHLNDEPVLAGPPRVTYRMGKFLRKHRRAVTASVMFVLTLLVGLGTSLALYFQAVAAWHATDQARSDEKQKTIELGAALKDAEAKKKLAEALAQSEEAANVKLQRTLGVVQQAHDDLKVARKDVEQQLHLSRRGVYNLQLLQASNELERDPRRTLAMLLDRERCPLELHDFTWQHLQRQSRPVLVNLNMSLGERPLADLSPDGRWLVAVGRTGLGQARVLVRDLISGAERIIGEKEINYFHISNLCFAPDGKTLLVDSSLFDLTSGQYLGQVYHSHHDERSYSARERFSPDGRLIFSYWGKIVIITETATGKESSRFTLSEETGKPLLFTEDSRGLWLHNSRTGKIHQLTLSTGKIAAHFTLPPVDDKKEFLPYLGGGIMMSADGRTIGRHKFHRTEKTAPQLLGASTAGLMMSPLADGPLLAASALIAARAEMETFEFWRLTDGSKAGEIKRQGRALHGYDYSLAPNGKTLAVVARGRRDVIELWDIESGKIRTRLDVRDRIANVAFLTDETLWVRKDEGFDLWDLAAGKTIATPHLGEGVRSAAWSANGKRLLLAGSEKLLVCELPAATAPIVLRQQTTHDPSPLVVYSPDGKTLAIAGKTKEVRLWDAALGQNRGVLQGNKGPIVLLRFSPDGSTLASVEAEGVLRLWDPQTGAAKAVLNIGPAYVGGLAFTDEGKNLVAACADGRVRRWSLKGAKPEQLPDVMYQTKGGITRLGLTADGSLLVSHGKDGLIRVWDSATGKELVTMEGKAFGMILSPNGHTVALVQEARAPLIGFLSHEVTVWNLKTGKRLHTLPFSRVGLFGTMIDSTRVVYSPDGQSLAAGSNNGDLRILNLRTGQGPDRFAAVSGSDIQWSNTANSFTVTQRLFEPGSATGILCLAFSADGLTLATGGGKLGQSGEVRFWDGVTGQFRGAISLAGIDVTHLVFSPNGRSLAAVDRDGAVRLLSVLVGQEHGRLVLHTDTTPFTPQDQRPKAPMLSFGGPRELIVHQGGAGQDLFWNLETGSVRQGSARTDRRTPLQASTSDGKIRTFVEQNGNPFGRAMDIKVIEAKTERETFSLKGSEDRRGKAVCVALSDDGRLLAVGRDSGRLEVWDVVAGRLHYAWPDQEGGVLDVALSPDGRWLASVSGENLVKVWEVPR
jgi:serine/threonine protein kinase/WD40 repeat protein